MDRTQGSIWQHLEKSDMTLNRLRNRFGKGFFPHKSIARQGMVPRVQNSLLQSVSRWSSLALITSTGSGPSRAAPSPPVLLVVEGLWL